jgi:Clp amino terminal domain, pathogenicity island component
MAYKGTDLDLLAPRAGTPAREASGPTPAERMTNGAGTQPSNAGAGPIAVDDTVLACCNCAFDVARFHASDEVRLEHLLHALTRVGGAVEVLGELGVRVDALRRETAVAIAAEMPAGALEGEAMPHASAAFEDVLRRSADQAARGRAPADLHDLLRTMLGGGPASPAASLLIRSAADPQRLERWRDAPLRAALTSAALDAHTESAAGQFAPAAAEALLGRLDRMEASMRSLQTQVAADRQSLGDLLRDLQSGLQALRSEGALAAVSDRTQAAERTQAFGSLVETKLGELGKSVTALAKRLAGIDNLGTLGERLAGVDKLAAASDSWQDLHTHMETLEGRIGKQTLDVANRIADAFSERLTRTETGLQHLQQETERHWSSNGERQIALEASVRAHLQAAEEAGKKQERDLGEVYQALVKLGANQQTLGDNFTAWRIETGGDIGIVNNGLHQLEQTVLDLLGHLGNDIQALRREGYTGGFKRWLYGTGNVSAGSWRDETPAPRHAPEPAAKAKDETSGDHAEIVKVEHKS